LRRSPPEDDLLNGMLEALLGKPAPMHQRPMFAAVENRPWRNRNDSSCWRLRAQIVRRRPRRLAGTDQIEVLTTTGKYFWVPTERVASIVFHPPKRPRDLAWRRATISVNEGPDGEVYIPAIYDSAQPEIADNYRLGHNTDWTGDETGPVRGIGQRVFLAGDDAHPIMEIVELRFRRMNSRTGRDRRAEQIQRAQLPLLDRLIDDAPDVQRAPPDFGGRGSGAPATQRASRHRGAAERAAAQAVVARGLRRIGAVSGRLRHQRLRVQRVRPKWPITFTGMRSPGEAAAASAASAAHLYLGQSPAD
jgi:hypothetical protein